MHGSPARGRGGGRHAVLARARLGDDALLAHAPGEKDLADGVVDLVRAGVGQVLALEPDAQAELLAEASAKVSGVGADEGASSC